MSYYNTNTTTSQYHQSSEISALATCQTPNPFQVKLPYFQDITHRSANLPQLIFSTLQKYKEYQAEQHYIQIPTFSRKLFPSRNHLAKAFCSVAPTLWNALPNDVRPAGSIGSFRSRLKSYLFSMAFPT